MVRLPPPGPPRVQSVGNGGDGGMGRVTDQFQALVPEGRFTVLSWNIQKSLKIAFLISSSKPGELLEIRILFCCFKSFRSGEVRMVAVAMASSCKGSRIQIVA